MGEQKRKKVMREPGLEPGSGRWQRPIVPLDHSRCADSPPRKFAYKAHTKIDYFCEMMTDDKWRENLHT